MTAISQMIGPPRGPFPESRIPAPFRWAAPRLARQRRPAIAERLRRLRAELGKDADGSNGPETSVRAVHAAEQVREALAYVRAVEKRLMAIQRLLMADAAADSRKQFRKLSKTTFRNMKTTR